MEIGLYIFNTNPVANPEFLTEVGRGAEERGFATIWLPEHVVTFDAAASRCPYTDDGTIGVPEGVGLLEPLTTMSYLAAVTSRVRLATGIAILPQRHPLYTAKEVANVDWLSNGRVDFGIGLGWCREEYEACGTPWERRGARCDEYIRLLRRLWEDDLSAFEGEFYELRPARFFPKPVQPRVPIHVGGESDAALRRAARHADGWHGLGLDPAGAGHCLARLESHLADCGRSLSDLQLTISPHTLHTPPPSSDDVKRFAEAGIDQVVIWCTAAKKEEIAARLDSIADQYLGVAY
jgi:probable F420-dependent oxidoreductase